MDKYRPYHGRKNASRRRRTYASSDNQSSSSRWAVRLYICVGLFVAAAVIKLLFPATFAGIGEKINTVVNYKAALTTLGEGFSGEKKFTTALGEAFTYAFTGQDAVTDGDENNKEPNASENALSSTEGGSEKKSAGTEAAVAAFNQDGALSDDEAADKTSGESFADAVIAAFMQDQEQYSDYDIPAGVTYAMPKILMDYAAPLNGVVSSSFGYRVHPTDGAVRFHYGTDIAADEGDAVNAFAEGKTIAVGEDATYGKYIILSHGSVETQYAHCAQVLVEIGQAVKMGQKIATVGMTGDATNPHLHFELKVNGVYVNPEYYL